MSVRLDEVGAFFANMLVSLGLTEHSDGFNLQNIPSYLIDRTFSVQFGQIQGGPANQMIHQFTMPVTINVFFKDYRNPNQLRQAALAKAQDIMGLMLRPEVRNGKGLKDIRPSTITVNPLSKSNDNSAILAMQFDVILMFAF